MHSRNVGPATAAIAATRNDHEPPRRDLLAAACAALTGVIVGAPVYRTGRDLSFVAEEWLRDAAELGMHFMTGPDGEVWHGKPIHDGSERAEARERHWVKLNNRPPLMRAVRAAVQRGFQA